MAQISRLRESGPQVPTGSSLEQQLVIEPISLEVVSFRGRMKLRQHRTVGVKLEFSAEHSLPFHMGASPGFPNV